MTRKDYVKFAALLKSTKPRSTGDHGPDQAQYDTWREIVDGVANIFAAENQQFDHDRFYKACDTAQ